MKNRGTSWNNLHYNPTYILEINNIKAFLMRFFGGGFLGFFSFFFSREDRGIGRIGDAIIPSWFIQRIDVFKKISFVFYVIDYTVPFMFFQKKDF